MSKKIEIIDKALVVTDTVTSEVLIDVPKGQYYYNRRELLDNGLIIFYDIDFNDALAYQGAPIRLSDAVDSTLTAFTESTFQNFCRANLI